MVGTSSETLSDVVHQQFQLTLHIHDNGWPSTTTDKLCPFFIDLKGHELAQQTHVFLSASHVLQQMSSYNRGRHAAEKSEREGVVQG